MYMRAQSWLENGPARVRAGRGGLRVIPIPRRRGVGDTQSAGFFAANPGAPNGIEPGAVCYDSSHDPGYVHGVSSVEWALQTPFGYNVTTQLSDAELACLTRSVSTGGGATPPVDGGPVADPGGGIPNSCPWYCALPGVSSVLTSGCNPATCNPASAPSTSSNALMVGGLVVGGLLLFAVLKGALK
jgi:hypothetical protein